MKINYRAEIDGLRAIAVWAVILYHAQFTIFGHQPFKGGFIGVDIFFVISGYLITSIILKELVVTGSFSFKHFYERRIRRILPILLFVMLASLPFAWIYLLPSSFVDFSKSILYSIGFSSNFYFWDTGLRYGHESGLLQPFLHTWSLSVEEQFYILFPIILIIIFKHYRKYLIHILFLGFIVSLGLSDWGSRKFYSFNFYFLPSRGWELLAGSILAYFEIFNGYRCKNRLLNLTFPYIGLFLIGYFILFADDNMPHPSFYTLSPIIGVCLIIWFSNKDEIITKVLSSKLFVGTGLISYSLYLWHYPIFAFARITEFSQVIFFELIIIIILIVISILSYFFIEKPFRNKKNKFSTIISFVIISIFVLTTFNYNIINNKGYDKRISEIISKNLPDDLSNVYNLRDSKNISCFGKIQGCIFNKNSKIKIHAIGDSHMASLNSQLADQIIKLNFQFSTSTLGGCLYFPGFSKVELKEKILSEECNYDYFKKLEQTFLNEKESVVIFFGRYALYLSDKHFDNLEGGIEINNLGSRYISVDNKFLSLEESFKKSVEKLKNHKIILVYPFPEAGFNVPNKLNILIKKKKKIKNRLSKVQNNEFITTSFEVFKNRNKSSFKLLDSIQGDNIYRIYPHKLFCNTLIKNRCLTHDDKDIFYSDDDHPSSKSVEIINKLIIDKIKQISN